MKFDKVHPLIGEPAHMHFLSTLWRGDTLYAYHITAGTHGPAVGLSTSTNGVDFNFLGVVLDTDSACAWDGTMASFPGVYYDAGTFYLTYEGNNHDPGCASASRNDGEIGLATSTDGMHFDRRAQPLMRNLPTGWESVNVGTPSLYRANDQWYMFYHAWDGNDCRIGVATGPTLENLTRYPGNPIVDAVSGTWQAGTAGHRDIMQVGNGYYMAFEGSTDLPYVSAQWSSGLTRSDDLLHWTFFAQNPVLPETQSYGHDGPSFVELGDVTWMYYRVTTSNNVTSRARVADESHGGFDMAWEAAALPHNVGYPDADGWAVDVHSSAGYLQYGPYVTTVPVGDNNAVWKIMIDDNHSDNGTVVRLEVSDYDAGGALLASRVVNRQTFRSAMTYEYLTLPFTLPASASGHRIEFRLWWYGISYVRLQRVGLS